MSTHPPGQQTASAPEGLHVRRCGLTLHDGVYFATREMGALFETGPYIHNYALSYALFNDSLIRTPHYVPSHRPRYVEDLEVLNRAGIYVTPARPVDVDYLFVTYKIGQTTYHQRAERFDRPNYPRNIGRVRELAPGSRLEFFIIGDLIHEDGSRVHIPHWIRLGKWMSKAEVEIIADERATIKTGEFICLHPLNPLDIGSARLGVFNVISMPPSSLVVSARLEGRHVTVGDRKYERQAAKSLPADMAYSFPPEVINNVGTKRRGKAER